MLCFIFGIPYNSVGLYMPLYDLQPAELFLSVLEKPN
jgi:hypothetical protein